MEKDKLIKMLIGFLPLLLLFLDPPEGMDPKAWGLFPFYAGAILMVMLRPVGEATALAIFLGLYAVIMRGHTVALSGFALTMTWLVVGAYIIAQAFRDTNLGKRISFWMIRIFGRSTLGLGYAAAFADFIIAPVTPSNAARTGGIIYPIFLSVAESLGSYPDKNPRGFGAYISVLLYVVTMCTGITFLTGYAANTVAWALADQMLGLHITWLQWTTAFILPAGIVLLIAPYVMYLIYRPTLTKIDNVRIAREGLAVIGPMSSKEKILLCLFVLAIIGWATSSYTKINSTAVVLGFIAVCLMTNVLKWKDIAKNSQVWTTLMWYGGILGLALGMVFATSAVRNSLMNYIGYFAVIAAIMLAALVVFMLTVRENEWAAEMQQQSVELGLEDKEEAATGERKLSVDEVKSLIFLLLSIVLWFFGYNAVTSKYSVYASNILHKDYNLTLIIAQAAAIISYLPVGFIASRVGRKKTILAGVIMLTAAFTTASFMSAESPTMLMNAMFALAGIAWATINVNSFPMVVEMCSGGNVGKYTGFYYTASMAAQVATPMLSGLLMDRMGMHVLFPYAAVFTALAFVTMLFVRHGDSKPEAKWGLEALDEMED